MATAFQANAFQNNAFQIDAAAGYIDDAFSFEEARPAKPRKFRRRRREEVREDVLRVLKPELFEEKTEPEVEVEEPLPALELPPEPLPEPPNPLAEALAGPVAEPAPPVEVPQVEPPPPPSRKETALAGARQILASASTPEWKQAVLEKISRTRSLLEAKRKLLN